MLVEWYSWVCSLRPDELLLVLGVLLLVDAPRYAYSVLGMAIWDILKCVRSGVLPGPGMADRNFHPTVSVIVAGHNEAATIQQTMRSILENYSNLELIVVDDGSTDGMTRKAQEIADEVGNVMVLHNADRGGKSSALNLGLRHAAGDVVVTVDADSCLEPNAIYELVQPLADDRVGAVSATVVAWNPFQSLCAWLQAYEYRQTIFISRMTRGRLGILGIVSGAFGAFRTDVLKQLGGWDVGPGEDGDLILRMRKAGHQIEAAPYSTCRTNVPTSWVQLFAQRCRWDRTVITFECRKHNDLGSPFSKNFVWSNFVLMAERWFFNVICVYTFWLYGVWVLTVYPSSSFNLLLLLYCCGICVEFLQMLGLLFYSDRLWHDLRLSLVLPLYPLYQVYMKTVNLITLTREILCRESGKDNFVPLKVRSATWRW